MTKKVEQLKRQADELQKIRLLLENVLVTEPKSEEIMSGYKQDVKAMNKGD